MRSIEESLVFIQWILSDLQEILGCWAIRKFWIAGWMSRFRTNFHYFWELPIEGRILTSRGCWEGFLPLKGTLPETISGWLEAAKGKMRFWHIVYIYIYRWYSLHFEETFSQQKPLIKGVLFQRSFPKGDTSYEYELRSGFNQTWKEVNRTDVPFWKGQAPFWSKNGWFPFWKVL